MKPEIEAKFLSVNHDQMRAKLQAAGAKCLMSMRLMKRKNYDYPDRNLEKVGGWVRLRDEGGGVITMSYKQTKDRGLHGTHEVSVVVDSFDITDAFLTSIGLQQKTYQETKRESWEFGHVQVELDLWPWIKPILEIEGPTEEEVRKVAKLLGLSWSDALHGSAESAYIAEYDVTEQQLYYDLPAMQFDQDPPTWLATKKRQS